MEIVVNNPREGIELKRARDHMNGTIRILAANILRMVRGSGDPTAFLTQMIEAMEAMKAFHAAGDSVCPIDGRQALQISSPEQEDREQLRLGTMSRETFDRHDASGYYDRAEAIHTIVLGALQMAASQLIGQKTQRAAGEAELLRGIKEFDEYRAQQRKLKRQAATAAKRKKKPRRGGPGGA